MLGAIDGCEVELPVKRRWTRPQPMDLRLEQNVDPVHRRERVTTVLSAQFSILVGAQLHMNLNLAHVFGARRNEPNRDGEMG